jgi:hypothetical protein
MQLEDFENFRDGVNGVMSFYGKTTSNFALDVWWNALKHYDLRAVNDAFGRHVANPDAGQFAPKPADIIRMLQGSTMDAAFSAWAKVDRAVRHVGAYVDVVFDDALIHRVIHDMGGWIALGTKTEDEWPFVAREFENRYRGFKARNETPEYPKLLIGIAGAHNAKEGYANHPPTLIGSKTTALAVLNGGTDKPLLGIHRMKAEEVPLVEYRKVA